MLQIFITDAVFCSAQKLVFFNWAQSYSFLDEQIYPVWGEQGRPAHWGSRWCRRVRKCFLSSMHCLTLGKYLCFCFFSYEISGAILTYLKSAVEFWRGQRASCCHTTDLKIRLQDVCCSKHRFHFFKKISLHLRLSPFLPNFSCVKALSPPNWYVLCELENGVHSHEICFKYFASTLLIQMNWNTPKLSCP